MSKKTNPNRYYSLPEVVVFEDVESADKYVKKFTEGRGSFESCGAVAEVHYYDMVGERDKAIICFPKEWSKKKTPINRVTVLSHECSHIVDDWIRHMGVECCDTETRAYSLQAILRCALEQLGDKWVTSPVKKH